VIDDEGNIIWQGPPGQYPGGYDENGDRIIPPRNRHNDGSDPDDARPLPDDQKTKTRFPPGRKGVCLVDDENLEVVPADKSNADILFKGNRR